MEIVKGDMRGEAGSSLLSTDRQRQTSVERQQLQSSSELLTLQLILSVQPLIVR